MSIDISAPSRGMIEVLNKDGSWDSDNNRTGGTWVGGIKSGNAYMPTAPFEGDTPAIFCSSIPLVANIVIAGAGCYRLTGVLELYYVDRTSAEQDRPLAVIDGEMGSNCNEIIEAILGDLHLNDSVVAVTQPIEVLRDPEGIFREWSGSEWCWCTIHVPFIGKE